MQPNVFLDRSVWVPCGAVWVSAVMFVSPQRKRLQKKVHIVLFKDFFRSFYLCGNKNEAEDDLAIF